MKAKIILTILIIFTVVVLFVWGYTKNTGSTASVQNAASRIGKSALIASETLYDFGTISMKAGDVSKDFVVTNSTDKDITIKTALTSCMCTTAFIVAPDGSTKGPFGMAGMSHVPPANERIGAGENRIVRVIFDPNAHGPAGVGKIDRFVTLTDASGGVLELEIQAVVTP